MLTLRSVSLLPFSGEVEHLAKELKMHLYRTSVKEDVNVASVFQNLAENYVSKVNSYSDALNDDLFLGNGNGVGGHHLLSTSAAASAARGVNMLQIGSR